MMKDPEIKVSEALAAFNGNQAELGRVLDVKRSSVNEWVSSERLYVPALQAYRLISRFPEKFEGKPL